MTSTYTCSESQPYLLAKVNKKNDLEINVSRCMYPAYIVSCNLDTDIATIRFIERIPLGYEEIAEATVNFETGYYALGMDCLIDEPKCLQLDYKSIFLVGTFENKLVIYCRLSTQPTGGAPLSYCGVLTDYINLRLYKLSYDIRYPKTYECSNIGAYIADYFDESVAQGYKFCAATNSQRDGNLGIDISNGVVGTNDPISAIGMFYAEDVNDYFFSREYMFPGFSSLQCVNRNLDLTQVINRDYGYAVACKVRIWYNINGVNHSTTFRFFSPCHIGKTTSDAQLDINFIVSPGSIESRQEYFPATFATSPLPYLIADDDDGQKYSFSYIYHDNSKEHQKSLKTYTFLVSPQYTLSLFEETDEELNIDGHVRTKERNLYTEYPTGPISEPYLYVEDSSSLEEHTYLLARTGGKDFNATIVGDTTWNKYISAVTMVGSTPHNSYSEDNDINHKIDYSFNDYVFATTEYMHTAVTGNDYIPSSSVRNITGEATTTYQHIEFLFTDLAIGAFLFVEYSGTVTWTDNRLSTEGLEQDSVIHWDVKVYLFHNEVKTLLFTDNIKTFNGLPFNKTMIWSATVFQPITITTYDYSGLIGCLDMFWEDGYYDYSNFPDTVDDPYAVNSISLDTIFMSYRQWFNADRVQLHPSMKHYTGYCEAVPWPSYGICNDLLDKVRVSISSEDWRYIYGRNLYYSRSQNGKIFHIFMPKPRVTLAVDRDNDYVDFINVYIVNGTMYDAVDLEQESGIPDTILSVKQNTILV